MSTTLAEAPSCAESAAERTARHMRLCRRLADLAMQLAEAAAARAAEALDAPAPDRHQDPADPDAQPLPGTHPATLFTRLAGVVRQAIALECRVVAGHAASMAPHTQADPRRAKIRLAIRHATEGRLNRAELRHQADTLLNTELALDPDGTASLPDLLATLCEDLNFRIDYDRLANDLGWPAETPWPPH